MSNSYEYERENRREVQLVCCGCVSVLLITIIIGLGLIIGASVTNQKNSTVTHTNCKDVDWNRYKKEFLGNEYTPALAYLYFDKEVTYLEAYKKCRSLHPNAEVLTFQNNEEWIKFVAIMKTVLTNSTPKVWIDRQQLQSYNSFWEDKLDSSITDKSRCRNDCNYMSNYSLQENKPPTLFTSKCTIDDKYHTICVKRCKCYLYDF